MTELNSLGWIMFSAFFNAQGAAYLRQNFTRSSKAHSYKTRSSGFVVPRVAGIASTTPNSTTMPFWIGMYCHRGSRDCPLSMLSSRVSNNIWLIALWIKRWLLSRCELVSHYLSCFLVTFFFARTSTRPLLSFLGPIGNKLAPIARPNGLSWFVSFGGRVPATVDGVDAGCDLPVVHFVLT